MRGCESSGCAPAQWRCNCQRPTATAGGAHPLLLLYSLTLSARGCDAAADAAGGSLGILLSRRVTEPSPSISAVASAAGQQKGQERQVVVVVSWVCMCSVKSCCHTRTWHAACQWPRTHNTTHNNCQQHNNSERGVRETQHYAAESPPALLHTLHTGCWDPTLVCEIVNPS